MPKFIEFVQREDCPRLQFEAAWCITNIASGDHEHTQVLLEKGALDVLVGMLRSKNLDVVEQAIWALGNIAGDTTENRNLVLNAGGCEPIAQLLDAYLNNQHLHFS